MGTGFSLRTLVGTVAKFKEKACRAIRNSEGKEHRPGKQKTQALVPHFTCFDRMQVF